MANTLNLGNGNWGVKKDSLLGYNSENGNFKPLPFDFTRASSATVVNKAGLIETVGSGEPRIDFSNDAKGALKLEPQRSNLITQSNDFSNASWTKGNNPTITTNIAIAPDGTLTADGIQDTDGANLKAVYESASVNSNSTTTLSVFVKKESTKVNFGGLMLLYSGGTIKYVYGIIDEVNGTITIAPESNIGSSSAKVEDYGTYWRFTLTGTDNGGNTTARFQYYASFSTNGANVTGNSIGSVRTLWGAQLEQGSYATSYIPTQGSAVTRGADACNNGGNEQVINSTEGVLYAEFKNTDTSNYKLMSISDGTGNNRVFVGTRLNNGYIYYFVVAGGTTQASYISTQLADNFTKVAVKFKANDFSFWINGLKVSTDLSGSVPIGLNVIQFNGGSGTLDFNGNVKDVRVYNTALTDTELQALTT